jgi:hypothetical protein
VDFGPNVEQLFESHHIVFLVPKDVLDPRFQADILLVHGIMHLVAHLTDTFIDSELLRLVVVIIVFFYQVLQTLKGR